jgi:hypothetical protein
MRGSGPTRQMLLAHGCTSSAGSGGSCVPFRSAELRSWGAWSAGWRARLGSIRRPWLWMRGVQLEGWDVAVDALESRVRGWMAGSWTVALSGRQVGRGVELAGLGMRSAAIDRDAVVEAPTFFDAIIAYSDALRSHSRNLSFHRRNNMAPLPPVCQLHSGCSYGSEC